MARWGRGRSRLHHQLHLVGQRPVRAEATSATSSAALRENAKWPSSLPGGSPQAAGRPVATQRRDRAVPPSGQRTAQARNRAARTPQHRCVNRPRRATAAPETPADVEPIEHRGFDSISASVAEHLGTDVFETTRRASGRRRHPRRPGDGRPSASTAFDHRVGTLGAEDASATPRLHGNGARGDRRRSRRDGQGLGRFARQSRKACDRPSCSTRSWTPGSIAGRMPTPLAARSRAHLPGTLRRKRAAMALKTIVPGQTRIGWIGTGVMGSSMCGHLIGAGFSATVYNRTQDKGPSRCSTRAPRGPTVPQAVAEASDVVFTIVGFPADVRSVILGDDGVLAGSRPGTILVDMTTSEPSLAVEIAEAGPEERRAQRRRAGLRRRRRCPRSPALDHDRRRQGGRRRARRPAGRRWARPSSTRAARRGPAHQDGQPDADRHRHDRRLRSACSTATGPAWI